MFLSTFMFNFFFPLELIIVFTYIFNNRIFSLITLRMDYFKYVLYKNHLQITNQLSFRSNINFIQFNKLIYK